jgi:chromosome segregation ATPase
MSAQNQLKHLQRRLEGTQATLKALREEKKEINKKINNEEASASRLKKELESLKNNEQVIVSEHAILRYFERVLKFNIEEIKEKIAPKEVIDKIKLLGNGLYPANGHRLKVRNGTIVTVVIDNDLIE